MGAGSVTEEEQVRMQGESLFSDCGEFWSFNWVQSWCFCLLMSCWWSEVQTEALEYLLTPCFVLACVAETRSLRKKSPLILVHALVKAVSTKYYSSHKAHSESS